MLRARLLVLLVVAALLGLAACTPDDGARSEPSSSASSASASTSGPVQLRLGVYGGKAVLRGYHRLATVFEKRHPGVEVKVESAPSATASHQRLDRAFADGTAPDVFLTDAGMLPGLVEQGRVRSVDGLLEQRGISFGDNYQRLGLEAMAANSALQCMPTDVSPYVVFYNKRLLDLSLLPRRGETDPTPEKNGWSWNQFGVAAAQMSRGGVKGLYLAPKLTTIAPLMRSDGADIVDDPVQPTTLTLSEGRDRNSLAKVLDVARNQTVTLTRSELDEQGAISRFEHGKLGMMIGTRSLVPRLRTFGDLRFDVFPLPSLGRSATIADISGLCINRVGEHVNEAADFLAFASGDRGSDIMAATGGVVPANLNALNSQAFRETKQFPLNVDVFARGVRRATTMPNPPAWPEVVRQTQPLVDRMFYASQVDLDRLLPRMEQISQPLLAQPTPSPTDSGSPTDSPTESPTESPTG